MDEIELKVHDMSSTLQPADAYALVLEEVNGNRKLPIIIGQYPVLHNPPFHQ